MNTMLTEQQFTQINQHLAGIELPPEPNWWPLIWMVTGVVIALLIVVLIIWRKNRIRVSNSLAGTVAQRLHQIQQQWRNGELDQRSTAYQLAALLRLGLGLKQLDHNTPDSLADQQPQWQAMITLLQQLRYQTNTDAQLNEQTFVIIQNWLRQGAPEC